MTRSAHSLCLHMNDDDPIRQSLSVGICDPPHSYNESTKVQNPGGIHMQVSTAYAYILRMRVRVPRCPE